MQALVDVCLVSDAHDEAIKVIHSLRVINKGAAQSVERSWRMIQEKDEKETKEKIAKLKKKRGFA